MDRQLHLAAIDSKVGDATLILEPEQVRLRLASGEEMVISRHEQPEQMQANRMLGDAVLLVRRDKKRLAWKLEEDQLESIEAWIGPPTVDHLNFAFKQRYGLSLPIGLFLILLSLPYDGNPEAGIEPAAFDVVGGILGGGLVLLWALSRWRPHAMLFLLDAGLFTLLALDTVYNIATGDASVWWLIFAAVAMVFAQSGVGLYKKYRDVTTSGSGPTPSELAR